MNQNPYQVPSADLEQPYEAEDRAWHEPRSVGSGQGVTWFSEGWRLFMKEPMMFIVIGILFVVLTLLMALVPLLGSFALMLVWPHFAAGLYLAARHAFEGQTVSVGDLFQPFSNLGNLLALGGLYLGGGLLLSFFIGIVMAVLLGASGFMSLMFSETAELEAFNVTLGLSLLLAVLIALALSIPYAMAFLFAPILVHQQGLAPFEAIKQSFRGCIRNVLPFLIWGLLWLVVGILMVVLILIPFLGWLVAIAAILVCIPLSFNNIYAAYRDIYLD